MMGMNTALAQCSSATLANSASSASARLRTSTGMCSTSGPEKGDVAGAVAVAVASACEAIGRQPESKSAVTSTLIMGCAIAETTGIYALIVAILLIFVAPGSFANILKTTVESMK